MARSFSSDLITLPRVDARDAVTLASQLEAAAAAQGVVPTLPAPIQSALDDVAPARTDLQTALTAGNPLGTPTKKEADRREDTAVVALYKILSGWASLAEFIPEGKAAQQVLDRAFADGVQFVNIRYEREWAVVDSKLKLIDGENLDDKIAAVGATPALAFLRNVHATYGSVIGTTDALPDPPEIGKKRDALLIALRRYVVRVVAHVEPKHPKTQDLADTLLLPLSAWESAKPPAKKKTQGDDEGEGGSGGAGGAPGGGAPPPP
jgi:hypothetical protein